MNKKFLFLTLILATFEVSSSEVPTQIEKNQEVTGTESSQVTNDKISVMHVDSLEKYKERIKEAKIACENFRSKMEDMQGRDNVTVNEVNEAMYDLEALDLIKEPASGQNFAKELATIIKNLPDSWSYIKRSMSFNLYQYANSLQNFKIKLYYNSYNKFPQYHDKTGDKEWDIDDITRNVDVWLEKVPLIERQFGIFINELYETKNKGLKAIVGGLKTFNEEIDVNISRLERMINGLTEIINTVK